MQHAPSVSGAKSATPEGLLTRSQPPETSTHSDLTQVRHTVVPQKPQAHLPPHPPCSPSKCALARGCRCACHGRRAGGVGGRSGATAAVACAHPGACRPRSCRARRQQLPLLTASHPHSHPNTCTSDWLLNMPLLPAGRHQHQHAPQHPLAPELPAPQACRARFGGGARGAPAAGGAERKRTLRHGVRLGGAWPTLGLLTVLARTSKRRKRTRGVSRVCCPVGASSAASAPTVPRQHHPTFPLLSHSPWIGSFGSAEEPARCCCRTPYPRQLRRPARLTRSSLLHSLLRRLQSYRPPPRPEPPLPAHLHPAPCPCSPTLFASSQGRVFADLSGGAVASEDLVRWGLAGVCLLGLFEQRWVQAAAACASAGATCARRRCVPPPGNCWFRMHGQGHPGHRPASRPAGS